MMLGGILDRIFGGAPAPSNPSRLPPELVAAIAAASIFFRAPDREGNARVAVSLPTVGSFTFDGIREAAERIAAAWPEITAPQARHAAHLLAGEVGRRSYMTAKGLRPARQARCLDFKEFDHARL